MAKTHIVAVVLLFWATTVCVHGNFGQHKRNGNDVFVGGYSETDITSDELQGVHEFAQKDVTDRTTLEEGEFDWELVKAESQVVAGTNYKLTYKHPTVDITCEVIVYDIPWQKERRVTKNTCVAQFTKSRTRSARSPMTGGVEDVEIGDQGVLDAVEFIVDDYNHKSNSLYRTMASKMIHVSRQVVAGYLYRMTVEFGESSKCRNNEENRHAKLDDCPVDRDTDDKFFTCHMEILDQVWMDPRFTVQNIKCDKKNTPTKSQPSNVDGFMNKAPGQGILGGDHHDFAHYGVFDNFKSKYNKKYESKEEDQYRFGVFRQNMEKILDIQSKEMGSATYGVTEFADMTQEEFAKTHLTPKWDLKTNPFLQQAEIPEDDPPAAFDWRDHNAVTAVKNQGSCGSCWAFSTTGNIEGQWAIKKKQLLSLSEQELVDCDKLDDGCDGGLPSNAYQSIIKLGGLETEKDYPYEGDDEKCHFDKKEVEAKITGALNISSDETKMASWLAKNGPISIGINAMAMQFYFGGVSHPWGFLCDPDSLDHGVLIVGYGVQKGWFSDSPYWIVKNSWGASWGEKGYYLVYRGDGTCGLNKMPTSAVV